jgi:flagellar basal-body rod modification protein FlgD
MLKIGNTDVLLSKVMEVLPIAEEAGSTGSTAPTTSGGAKPAPSTAPTTGPTTA